MCCAISTTALGPIPIEYQVNQAYTKRRGRTNPRVRIPLEEQSSGCLPLAFKLAAIPSHYPQWVSALRRTVQRFYRGQPTFFHVGCNNLAALGRWQDLEGANGFGGKKSVRHGHDALTTGIQTAVYLSHDFHRFYQILNGNSN